jgi:hypothetical protein
MAMVVVDVVVSGGSDKSRRGKENLHLNHVRLGPFVILFGERFHDGIRSWLQIEVWSRRRRKMGCGLGGGGHVGTQVGSKYDARKRKTRKIKDVPWAFWTGLHNI